MHLLLPEMVMLQLKHSTHSNVILVNQFTLMVQVTHYFKQQVQIIHLAQVILQLNSGLTSQAHPIDKIFYGFLLRVLQQIDSVSHGT